MKEKVLNPGDSVKIKTKEKNFDGIVLESYIPEIILLKLDSGYNVGIKESEILDVVVVKKCERIREKEIQFEQKKEFPNVVMIITGGTISSRLDPKTGAVKWTSINDIFTISPEIRNICNIVKIENPFMKASEDMSYKDWKLIAQICEKYLNDNSIQGIIITHGTDFLHYTSAALSFFIKNLNKPIAITYSQRSIDRGSTDASLNLLCAAKYAVSEVAEIAIIGHKNLDDEICLAMPGTKTRKMHTSRRDAFKIINSEPVAEISKSDFKVLKRFNAKHSGKVVLDTNYDEKIAIVKVYPGQNPDILEFYEHNKYKGLILEVSGLGHVPTTGAVHNWLLKIKKSISKGIIICATPQTIYGRLNPKVYSPGRELEKTGIIFLEDMLSETAFVKLGFVLGHKQWTKDLETIKQKLLENLSGEISEKLGFD